MNLNKKKKIVLVGVVFVELVIGSIFLFDFYQQKIVHKTQDLDKVAVINKENLIFPEESEFKYYWELKPNITVIDNLEWLGYQAKYTYNADGLHERFDYEVEKPSNTFRIITLGDSFTFGQFVNTEDNWTEQLEDLLNGSLKNNSKIKKFEVINLGMSGFDIPYVIKRYQDIGAKYNPDLIIWFESGSGFTRINEIEREMTQKCLEEYERSNIDVNNKAVHPCHLKTDNEVARLFLIDSGYKINSELIDKLNIFLATLNPEKIMFFSFTKNSLYFNGQLLELAIKQIRDQHPDIKYLPIVEDICQKQTRLGDGHPSKIGHHLIAQTIYRYMKNNLLK